ncbi:MAG TPA: hypothetical protein VFC65_05995 [Prolixibacteraceae bacterium]|nr:hypothetical protein [Prolixibacteraceae bacterium]
MTKKILNILIFLLPIHLLAQTQYEKGYVIDDDEIKNPCWLFNFGMENKGEDYLYKFEKNVKAQKNDIKDFQEFGVEGEIKYVRKFIKLDVSSGQIKTLNDTIGRSDILYAFLQELVGLELASLYYFYLGKYRRRGWKSIDECWAKIRRYYRTKIGQSSSRDRKMA